MHALTDEQRRMLDEQGFLLLPGLLSTEAIQEVRARLEALWEEEGQDAGSENYIEAGARRLANLAGKGDLFRPLFAHPLVLAAARHVVGPDVRLSMLNARDALPGSGARQPFHADTDSGGKPDAKGYYACTAIWMLDDFTAQNGATRLVPGSHHSGKLPKEGMADIFGPHLEEVVVTGTEGDVLVFNGHCWHAGGENRTRKGRCALLAHYLRADIPRAENRQQCLSPEVTARMTQEELALLGVEEA